MNSICYKLTFSLGNKLIHQLIQLPSNFILMINQSSYELIYRIFLMKMPLNLTIFQRLFRQLLRFFLKTIAIGRHHLFLLSTQAAIILLNMSQMKLFTNSYLTPVISSRLLSYFSHTWNIDIPAWI